MMQITDLHLGCQQSWPIELQENINTFEKVSCQIQLPRNEINNMDQNQPITTKRRDLLNLLKKACVSWEFCYSVWMEAKNIKDSCIFDLQ